MIIVKDRIIYKGIELVDLKYKENKIKKIKEVIPVIEGNLKSKLKYFPVIDREDESCISYYITLESGEIKNNKLPFYLKVTLRSDFKILGDYNEEVDDYIVENYVKLVMVKRVMTIGQNALMKTNNYDASYILVRR